MDKPYLEITYRQGKPLAAYLYLSRRPGDKATRTERHDHWLVDFTSDGRAIGIEFTRIGRVNLADVNHVLMASNQPAVSVHDLVPLEAA
jgi:uncharacterized protein YuzE